jgi:polar amino acid transport system permease protein
MPDLTETGPQPVVQRPEDLKAIPVRHPWRWVAVFIIGVLFAQLLHWLVWTQNARKHYINPSTGKPAPKPNLDWQVVWQYLFDPAILKGIELTLILTVVAMVLGVGLGLVLAVMRLSGNPVLRSVAWVYIWFFRATPVFVQILVWFFLPAILDNFSVGVPFGWHWLSINPQTLITSFVAATLGLGLNEAAYMSEIVRAGLISVDEGQMEAASAIGLSRTKTMWRIVIPQAMRVIVPPTGNETISMLKTTSLVSAISVFELLYTAQIIYSRNYQQIPLLVVACIWYLIMTSVLMSGQYYIERYYAKGSSRQLPMTPIQKIRNLVGIGGTA